MGSVINVSIWFLPLREEMEERRNGSLSLSLSLQRDGNPAARPLLPPRGMPPSLLCSNPQVVLTVYVITTLITSVLVGAL